MEKKEIKLKGVLPRTASWVRLIDNGDLEAELFDFSSEAESHFGNDVAFTLMVPAQKKLEMLDKLGDSLSDIQATDDALLASIGDQFLDYYGFKRWLEEEKIPFETQFDPYA